MITKFKNFMTSLGVITIDEHIEPFTYNITDYDLKNDSDSEKIVEHKNFLKSVLEDENNRLGFIENKTSQIISQTSIVFSLVGLFVPIIMERFEDSTIYLKISIIILLLITFSFYLLSITNALKNFNVKKFRYPYTNPANVLDFKKKSIVEFNSELVRDYLYSINKSIKINNEKATNLLHAYKAFKYGNFSTGVIVMFVCSMLLFTKKEESFFNIKEPIEIKNLDSLLKNSKPIIIIQKSDTIEKVNNNSVSTKKYRK